MREYTSESNTWSSSMTKTGLIFDVKEFAVFDGPGIRQTVFFKGCPLHCSWCHNPEGLKNIPELMVSSSACIHCGKCTDVCAQESCTACGGCVSVCPLRLRRIAGTKMTSQELADTIHENSDYYGRCGGGVTFSGGEPLMQAEFLIELLQLLPDVHKAIETSGFTDSATFKNVVSHLDYVLMDIKIFDRELHRKYTGVSNELILQNAKILCAGDTPFVIRIPVIPGVNDNEQNFRQTAQWIAGAKALEKIELLPYHKTAGAKYSSVGRVYNPMFDIDQVINISGKIFEEYNIRSNVL